MKRAVSLISILLILATAVSFSAIPAGAVENPYGVTSVGCITNVIINSNDDLGGVDYFNGEVTSYYQGVSTKKQYRYDVYGAIGSKESKMFVYSYGNSTDQSYANHSVQDMVEHFEAENPAWKAIAAVNGDFFDIETSKTKDLGEPEGPMIQNGDIYKAHHTGATGRGVVGITYGGEVIYSAFGSQYREVGYGTGFTISTNEYKLRILGEHKTNAILELSVKQSSKGSESNACFVTPDTKAANFEGFQVAVIKCNTYRRAHIRINGADAGTRGFFIEGEVTEIRSGRENDMPEAGYVLLSIPSKDKNYENLKEGTAVKLQKAPIGKWAEVENAIGFKQIILAEGNILLQDCFFSQDTSTWTAEDHKRYNEKTKWTEDTVYAGAWKQRTALGFKEDGTPILLVTGKEKDYNTGFGASYYELGEQLKALGCVNGFALDGGGSSTFVIKNSEGNFETVFGDFKNAGAKGRNVANAVILAVRDENISLPEQDEELELIPFEKPLTTVRYSLTKKDSASTSSDNANTADDTVHKGCTSSVAILPIAVTVCGICAVGMKRKKRR